jgi:predicted nucleotidyltransferase
MEYGLPDITLNTLYSIFRAYPCIREAVLYGSRAKGKYRSGSDIDLSLKTDETFTHNDLLRITGDFDDSDMPYFVDVSIYDRLSNLDLKAHIDRVGKVLYSSARESDISPHSPCCS